MYPRVVARRRSSVRVLLALLIAITLLLLPNAPFLIHGAAWVQGRSQEHRRDGHPKRGKPEVTLPNLDTVRTETPVARELPEPVPSNMRSRKNPQQPWDGRRFGDPLPNERGASNEAIDGERANAFTAQARPTRELKRSRNRFTQRAHAGRRVKASAPPTILDDTFIDNFYNYALPVYTPLAAEKPYWRDQLRVGYAHGQTSLLLAAIELGKTLFESAAYAARNRDNSQYVSDLYWTYLMRDAAQDQTGWDFWTGQVGTYGRENVRRAFEECGEFATLMSTLVPNGSASTNPISLITSRVDPRNQPGNGMLSRDGTWSVNLLSLPGRAGLDLGLTLAQSSMVWTKSGPYIYFDEDNGFPSPGFRLGFPTIQRKTFDAQTGTNTYLLLTPSGHRVELRQVGSSNIYEATDSSYLQLTDNGSSCLVRSTDGTQLTFSEHNNEYHCIQVKDSNGNFISVNYDGWGHITTVTDTLGRVITFNYDGNHNLLSITQSWNGQTHQWVTFGWMNKTMQSSFSNVVVVGTANNAVIPVINQVAVNDGSYFQFDYTNSLQVQSINRYHTADSPAIMRLATWFTYETPASDAPRILNSNIAAYNWTGINGIPGQVTTSFSVGGDGACVMTAPDGTIYKEYYGTGWQKGLTTSSEIWSGGVKQKWTTTAWTQDNTSSGIQYETNPRVTESNIYDAGGNRRRTTIEYFAQFGLPQYIIEYAADGYTTLRRTHMAYMGDAPYIDRRIIGLPYQKEVFDGSWNPVERTQFHYDRIGEYMQGFSSAPIQHDETNYGASFITGRGNLAAIRRFDVTDYYNESKVIETKFGYNSAGSVRFTKDGLDHQSTVSYADSFSDNNNSRNTFAYPTTATDPDGFSSYVQYNFDFGATTRTEGPPPAGQTQGAIQTMSYYSTTGQLERVTTVNNGAYKRFWYGPDYIGSMATVNNVADEMFAAQVFDALGRVILAGSNHPGSSGGYKAQETQYDLMGRVKKASNPTETTGGWSPTGDDASGWHFTEQTYDWKGRPLVTTNPDSTTKEASYSGCGCAGGEVVTLTDEGTLDGGVAKRRQQKIYSDVLGRTVKTEILNWQGGSVYSATVNTYNARDQVTQLRQFAGPEGSGAFQDTTITYDGYGRLKTKQVPEQTNGTNTTWTYNADDSIATVTDARGATSTFGYGSNNRKLINTVTQTLAGSPTINTSFSYDASGNRISMSDATGTVSFAYNSLSQLTSETKTFSSPGPTGNYTLSYEYNLAGQLKALTDPTGSRVDYGHDNIGRLLNATGSGTNSVPTYASGFAYRAWNAVKDFNFGSAHQHFEFDARLLNSASTVTGVNNSISLSHEYYDDGKVKKILVSPNATFARKLEYDQLGRLSEARTGNEALGGTTPDGPFRQSYSYDAFTNTVGRSYRVWTQSTQTESATFTNNRRQGWQYDSEGNLKVNDDSSFDYDAGNRQSNFASIAYVGGGSVPMQPVMEITQCFDGNGGAVKKVTTNRWEDEQEIGNPTVYESATTVYYLRASALGGQVVAELNSNGGKEKGYVFAEGMRVAEVTVYSPSYATVMYETTSPQTGNTYMTDNSGYVSARELDPLGADVSAPPPQPAVTEPVFFNPRFDPLPMEYGWSGPSGSSGVDDWYLNKMDAVQAQNLWDSGARKFALAILEKNPNVGIKASGSGAATLAKLAKGGKENTGYEGFPDGTYTWFGSAAANALGFVNANGIVVDPQNTGPLTSDQIGAIREQIGLLLTDKCATFINQLVSGLTGKPYDSKKQLLNDFDKVRNGKGFTWGGKYGGTQGGSLAAGTADIQINSMFFFTDKKYVYGAASSSLHELIHAITAAGDIPLANLVKDLGIEVIGYPGYIVPFPTDPKDDLAHSGYWGQALKNKCSPRGY